jgi:hypothetical protein
MKSFSDTLALHVLTSPKARPLQAQVNALKRHVTKCEKRLAKLIILPHVGKDDNTTAKRGPECEIKIQRLQELILRDRGTIAAIEMKISGHFNREPDSKPRQRRNNDRGRSIMA